MARFRRRFFRPECTFGAEALDDPVGLHSVSDDVPVGIGCGDLGKGEFLAGEVATMVLVPEVVDAVSPTPVLAAGGIARGRQIAAALALGAEGVWCGSVWLTTEEAETPPVVKDKFLAATSSDTVRSRSLTGKPARMLRTAWTDEWDRPDSPDPLGMPLQSALVSDPQLRINQAAGQPGAKARELATYFVGQVVGSLDRVRSARSVVLDMVEEFIDTVGQLQGLVQR